MKNLTNKGYTLIEIMIGVAILGTVGLAVSSFLIFAQKNSKAIQDDLSVATDVLIFERVLMEDLKASASSFNNLKLLDDRGLGFFDYITDVEDLTDKNARKLTLIPDKNEFVLIVEAEDSMSMIYSPAMAYNVGVQPTNMNQSATLQFVSLNKDDIVKKTTDGTGDLWKEGNLLMLDSPASFRKIIGTGLDYSVPARSPIFIGKISKTGPSVLTKITGISAVDFSHPLYPNETVASEDYFLRNIPAVGGGNPLVRLKQVRIAKYYLKTDQDKKVGVYRAEFDGSKFSEGRLLALGIKSFSLSRVSATKSVIDYTILRK